MAQIRGTAGYNLGSQDRFGGVGRADATNDPSPLEQIREQTNKIEEWLDNVADPVKPYVIYLFSVHCCCFDHALAGKLGGRGQLYLGLNFWKGKTGGRGASNQGLFCLDLFEDRDL